MNPNHGKDGRFSSGDGSGGKSEPASGKGSGMAALRELGRKANAAAASGDHLNAISAHPGPGRSPVAPHMNHHSVGTHASNKGISGGGGGSSGGSGGGSGHGGTFKTRLKPRQRPAVTRKRRASGPECGRTWTFAVSA
jgi:hypothetical protein